MYITSLTGISLPEERYLLLLGIAMSVFSSNNSFIIENILRTDPSYSWYELIDLESGKLKPIIKKTISKKANIEISEKFSEIVDMRNRIIHGFRITSKSGEQILGTKVKNSGEQFEITEEYLKKFIKTNDELSTMLTKYRGY